MPTGFAPYEESSAKGALRAVLAGLAAGSKVPAGAGFLQSIGTGVAEGLGQRDAAQQAAQAYAMKQMEAEQAREDRALRQRYTEAMITRMEKEKTPPPAKVEKAEKKEPWERTKEEQDAIISFESRRARALAQAKPAPGAKAAGGKPAAAPKPAKPSTGAERGVLAFYNRAKQAEDTIAKLESKISGLNPLERAQLQYAPNFAKSPEQQVYRQAQRAFTEARLRKESGAAIPPQEYENDAVTYFAQPGDSKEVADAKKAARKAVLDGLKFASGKAYDEFYGEGGQGAAPSPVSNFDPEAARSKYGY